MATTPSADLTTAAIKQWEESGQPKLTTYNDGYGNPTIGYGHTGSDVQWGGTITADQAEALLQQDIASAARAVDSLVTVPLNDSQRTVLTGFVMNGGPGMLANSTLLQKLNGGDYAAVPAELAKYNKAQDPQGNLVYSPGLANRRAEEGQVWNGNIPANIASAVQPSQPPPPPNLRPGDVGGAGAPPLYANGGLYGASAFAAAPQLASYSPQSPFDSVLFGNGAAPSNPLPPPADQAVASNQMPAPSQQASSWLPASLQLGGMGFADTPPTGQPPSQTASSWLPSSLQPGGAGFSDVLSGGNAAGTVPQAYGNMYLADAGPYGIGNLLNAITSGASADQINAIGQGIASQIDKLPTFGIGANKIGALNDLSNYIKTSVPDQAPGAVRYLQQAFATNPQLAGLIPGPLKPAVDAAFKQQLPPATTVPVAMPNLRPGQVPPLVASNPLPPPVNPAIPQLTSYGTSFAPNEGMPHSAPDQSPFSVTAMGSPQPSFGGPLPSIGSFGSSGYSGAPAASGGFNASTMNNAPSSFDAPPASTDPFSVSAMGFGGSPSNGPAFGLPSSSPAGFDTSPVDQFSFSNYAPPSPAQQVPSPSSLDWTPTSQQTWDFGAPAPAPTPSSDLTWTPTPQDTWDFGGQSQDQPQDNSFSASAFGSPISGPSSAPVSLASFGTSGFDSPSASSGFSTSTFGGTPQYDQPSPMSGFTASTFPQAPTPAPAPAPSPAATPAPISYAPTYNPPPPTPGGNALLGFGSPLSSQSFSGLPTTPNFMPTLGANTGAAAFLANGLPKVASFGAPTVAAPAPRANVSVTPPRVTVPAPHVAVVSAASQSQSQPKAVAATPSASSDGNDYPSIPSGSTLMGQYEAGTGGATYNTSQYFDPSANAVYDTYTDENGDAHTANQTNQGYEAPDYTVDQYSANNYAGDTTDINSSSADDAASSDASGTVLCTFFYRRGRLSRRLWLADARFARTLNPRFRKGYLRWAIPTVRRLQRGSPILELILWHVVVRPWATFAGCKMNLVRRRPLSGAFVHLTLGSVSWVLGGKD